MGNQNGNTRTDPFFFQDGRKLITFYPALLLLIVFSHAIGTDSPYRSLAYGNIALVLYFAYRLWTHSRDEFKLALYKPACFLCTPIAIVVLHFIADPTLAGMKEVRHISSAVFIMLGIGLFIDLKPPPGHKNHTYMHLFVLFILAYTLTQGVFVLWTGRSSGTTPNTHYLAQYCLLLLPASALLLGQSKSALIKALLALCTITLLLLLLQTHSRPAWLAAMICGLVYACLTPEHRWKIMLLLVAIAGALWLADVGSFASKSMELIQTVHKEERVTIWRDAWAMQTQSSPLEWLVGHGLNSFKNDFLAFSQYHHQGIDFNSPHNYLIELVYLSGVLGFSIVAFMILFLYYNLGRLYLRNTRSEMIKLLIISLTGNLLLCSIIVPFYTSYNLLILGIIGGITLSLERNAQKK
jgi:O-antigen ligase